MAQIVFESVVLTAVAGYLGLVVGRRASSRLVGERSSPGDEPRDVPATPTSPLASALQALVILVVCRRPRRPHPGAARAVKISPVEALRTAV